MLTVKLDVKSVEDSIKRGKTYTPAKKIKEGVSKLQNVGKLEKRYKVGKKVKKVKRCVLKSGNPLRLNIKELRKGSLLDCSVKLRKGSVLKVEKPKRKEPKLRKGSTLQTSVLLQKGSKLKKRDLLEVYKEVKVVKEVKEVSRELREQKKIPKKVEKIKEIKSIVDKESITEEKVIQGDREREVTKLVYKEEEKERKNKDIVYKEGMPLYEFLKENPKNRTEDIVLEYYSAKELKDLVSSGKVLKKRGKLII